MKDKDQYGLGKTVPHIIVYTCYHYYAHFPRTLSIYYVSSCHRVFIPQSLMITNIAYILPEFVECLDDSSMWKSSLSFNCKYFAFFKKGECSL